MVKVKFILQLAIFSLNFMTYLYQMVHILLKKFFLFFQIYYSIYSNVSFKYFFVIFKVKYYSFLLISPFLKESIFQISLLIWNLITFRLYLNSLARLPN
jgi:hypothetical protein